MTLYSWIPVGDIINKKNAMQDDPHSISPDMTVLDIVSRFRKTEAVFKKYDRVAGGCICCEALFDPLEKVAEKYNLDLQTLLTDLKKATGLQ